LGEAVIVFSGVIIIIIIIIISVAKSVTKNKYKIPVPVAKVPVQVPSTLLEVIHGCILKRYTNCTKSKNNHSQNTFP